MFKFEFRWEGVWQIEGFDFLVVADCLHGGRNSKTVMSRFSAEAEAGISVQKEEVLVLSCGVEDSHLRLDGEDETVAVAGPAALGLTPAVVNAINLSLFVTDVPAK